MEIQKKHRPLFITMLCSFYFIFWTVSLLALISAILIQWGSPNVVFSVIASQVNQIFLGAQVNMSVVTWFIALGILAGVVGYWLFQKWAVIVFAASTVALFIISLPPLSSAPTKLFYVGLILYTLVAIFSVNIAMIVLGVLNFKKMK